MGELGQQLQKFQKDALSRDLIWSLFVAAAKSYRFSSVLHPFPLLYYIENSDQKNMVLLREVISSVPSLSNSEALSHLPPSCVDLLKWAMSTNNFQLQMKDKATCLKSIVELTGQRVSTPDPTYVFEVIHSDSREEKFQELRNGRNVFHAYHGSRLDNFYSIVHNGLNGHLNKVALFGEGTYLSSELSLCLLYSPAGDAWKRSALGSKLACVAVCELIDDSSVKCQVKEGTQKEKRSRAQASNSTDSVPEKYYVVQNNDMLRLKYLLVYKSEETPRPDQSSRFGWVKEYKFSLVILAYVVLLLAIAIINSPKAVNHISRFFKRLTYW